MSSVNKVILIGNVCEDPLCKFMPNGEAVTTFSLATNERWKDKNTGQQQEKAEFHRLVFYRRLAEIAGEYLRKGAKVYIEGKLQTRKWEKEGQNHYTTEIIVNEMTMLGSKDAGGNQSAPQQAQQAQARPAPQQHTHNHDGFDDDIAF